MAGVVLGIREMIERVWHMAVTLGPVADSFAAWLLLRGLRTLRLRVARQNQAALAVARFLERHPAVLRGHYPGLERHAHHALARRQMPGGFGGLMTFELRAGFDGASTCHLQSISLPCLVVRRFGSLRIGAKSPRMA